MSIDKHIKILKYIMYFFIILSMFFGFLDKAKASTITSATPGWSSTQQTYNGNVWYNDYITSTRFANLGQGYLLFNITIHNNTGTSTNTNNQQPITEINVFNNNILYNCNNDSVQGYVDSNKQFIMLSVVCPFNATNGLTKIRIHAPKGQTFMWQISDYITFVGSEYQDIVKSIATMNTQLNANIDEARFNLRELNDKLIITNNKLEEMKNNNNTNTQNIINNNNQNNNTINNSIKDTNNTLKDDNIDTNSTSSTTSNWSNMNASNGTITNLLTLPIQLMQGYVNGMNSSCSPFNLGNLFDTNITLPCINIGNLIGSSLWGVIDILFSGFMIFGIAKKLIKIFNDFTNMKSNQVDELYGGGA